MCIKCTFIVDSLYTLWLKFHFYSTEQIFLEATNNNIQCFVHSTDFFLVLKEALRKLSNIFNILNT